MQCSLSLQPDNQITPSCPIECKKTLGCIFQHKFSFPEERGQSWPATSLPFPLLPALNVSPYHWGRLQTWLSLPRPMLLTTLAYCFLFITSLAHKLQPAERSQNSRQGGTEKVHWARHLKRDLSISACPVPVSIYPSESVIKLFRQDIWQSRDSLSHSDLFSPSVF